jgi:hypothetical protein
MLKLTIEVLICVKLGVKTTARRHEQGKKTDKQG